MKHTIDLHEITLGMPGLTKAYGQHLLECCVVSLVRNKHQSEVQLAILNLKKYNLHLNWQLSFTDQMDRTYQDQKRATEQAAECVSILLALHLTNYTIIERSVQKTGCDYWLGDRNDPLFQRKARLEISGIFNDPKEVDTRFKDKAKQIQQSNDTGLTPYISIVEFSTPCAKFASKP